MKKILFPVFLTFLIITTAFANSASTLEDNGFLTCILESADSPDQKTTTDKIDLMRIRTPEVVISNGQVIVGQEAYSFSYTASRTRQGFLIDVIFTEDNQIQDQIDEISCVHREQVSSAKFCETHLKANGRSSGLNFYCRVDWIYVGF